MIHNATGVLRTASGEFTIQKEKFYRYTFSDDDGEEETRIVQVRRIFSREEDAEPEVGLHYLYDADAMRPGGEVDYLQKNKLPLRKNELIIGFRQFTQGLVLGLLAFEEVTVHDNQESMKAPPAASKVLFFRYMVDEAPGFQKLCAKCQ